MRHAGSERAGAERRAGGRRARRLGSVVAAVTLLGSLGCSDGGGGGSGLFSFARRESPAVDTRVSAGSATDRLVTDGESAERIAGFRLTRSRIDHWLQAQDHLSLLANSDPEVARIVDGGGSRPRGEQTARAIDEAIARLEANGSVREVLARVGTSPAEFVLTGLAMHQAFLASTPAAPERLRRLAARNLRVMQRHESLLQRAPSGDRLRYAYLDSLGWTAAGDTLSAAGAVYDPWAFDTLAVADTTLPPLPPLDTLPPRADSARDDTLSVDSSRVAPRPRADSASPRPAPRADSLRLRPVVPTPVPPPVTVPPPGGVRLPPPPPSLPDSLAP